MQLRKANNILDNLLDYFVILVSRTLTKPFFTVLWQGSDHHIGSVGITMNETMLENHFSKCFIHLQNCEVSTHTQLIGTFVFK